MKSNNTIFVIGLSAYLILTCLALFFYEERALFGDIAFHLFYILKDGDFAIQNERFGAFITQSIPLLGSKLGWSLSTIVVAYSLVFALLYATVFVLLAKVFKNTEVSLVMLLLSTIMVTDTFFWIQSELPQGLAFMVLFFGMLSRKDSWKAFYKVELLLFLPMIATIAYFHPLIFIPFSFICAFYWLSSTSIGVDRKLIAASFGLFWTTFILKNTLLKAEHAYESTAMGGLKNFIGLFPNYFFIEANANFILYVLTSTLIVLFWGMLAVYGVQKKWLKFSLLLAGFMGYTLLVSVSFSQATFAKFYMENLYLPLSLMVAFPFVYDGFPLLKTAWQPIVLSSICLLAILRISSASVPYTKRLVWQRDFLAKTADFPQKKLLVDSKYVPKNKLLNVYWSSPYEFWLLSSLAAPNQAARSIMIHDQPDNFNYILGAQDVFVTYWGDFGYKDLDERYFKFNDHSPYIKYQPTN